MILSSQVHYLAKSPSVVEITILALTLLILTERSIRILTLIKSRSLLTLINKAHLTVF